MSNRYWVGGTANWDATAGTKWATTSGGAGGSAVPTSADDVFFDGNSGSGTVTVTATVSCKNLNFTGFTGTFAGSSAVSIHGNVTLVSGMTLTHTGQKLFNSGGVQTLTTNGKSIPGGTIFVRGGSTLSLQDNLTTSGNISFSDTVLNGTITTNNYNISCARLLSLNNGTRTWNFGSSTITTEDIICNDGSGIVNVNAGTSKIVCTGPFLNTFGSKTWYSVEFTDLVSGGGFNDGGNTFSILYTGPGQAVYFQNSVTNTINSIVSTATLASKATLIGFSGVGIIGKTSGTLDLSNHNIEDMTASGGATFNAYLTSGNVDNGGNTGWNFVQQGNFFQFI